MSVPVVCLEYSVWTWVMARPPLAVAPHYEAAVVCVAASIVVEVAAEVPFVLAELQLWNKTRVRQSLPWNICKMVIVLMKTVLLWDFKKHPLSFKVVVVLLLHTDCLLYCICLFIIFIRSLKTV